MIASWNVQTFENELLNEQHDKKPVVDEIGEIPQEAPNILEKSQNEKYHKVEPLPRENRNRRPPERYRNPYTFFNTTERNEKIVAEVKTYKEAIKSTKSKYWKEAMKAEVEALENNNTWTLFDETNNKNALPGKWVYRVKYGADGEVDKYKARYVAKGFAQIEGLDYFETYAPTCKPETFKTLLAVAAHKDLHLCQMDGKSAYLHSRIEDEIYLEQPQGFTKGGENRQTLVCKLKKSIHGLKQAAKNLYT